MGYEIYAIFGTILDSRNYFCKCVWLDLGKPNYDGKLYKLMQERKYSKPNDLMITKPMSEMQLRRDSYDKLIQVIPFEVFKKILKEERDVSDYWTYYVAEEIMKCIETENSAYMCPAKPEELCVVLIGH